MRRLRQGFGELRRWLAPAFVVSFVGVHAIAALPSISVPRRDFEERAGDQLNLNVAASGVPTPFLQWYRGLSGDASRPIAGANSAVLRINVAETVERYWVRASNADGSVDGPEIRVVPWARLNPDVYLTNARSFGAVLVGVGGDAVFRSNDDGRTWASVATIVNSRLQDVAQGAGLFVAVGERGFYSSPDLVSWTARNVSPAGTPVGATSIARGTDRFVAVGGATPFFSGDGVNWTAITLPAGVFLQSVVFDGRQFVAVGQVFRLGDPTANRVGVVFTSPDGLVWTRRGQSALPETAANAGTALERIVFAAGKYLTVGGEKAQVLVSPDAVNWVAVDLTAHGAARLRSVGAAGGRFVIAIFGDIFLSSPDGFNWSGATAPFLSIAPALANAPDGALLALGSTAVGPMVFASADGLEWSVRYGSVELGGLGVAHVTYGGGRAIGVRRSNDESVYASDDGRAWRLLLPSQRSTGLSPRARGVFFNGRFFVGGAAGTMLDSTDGETWRSRPMPSAPPEDFGPVFLEGGRLLAPTRTGIAWSTDGENWSFEAATSERVVDFAHGNGVFVGFGASVAGPFVMVSRDGVSWRAAASAPPLAEAAVAFGAGRFLAVGYGNGGRAAFSSINGETWTPLPLPESLPNMGPFTDVHFIGDRFLIAASEGIFFSTDGLNLQAGPPGPARFLTEMNGAVLAGTTLLRAADDLAVSINGLSPDQEVAPGGTAPLTVSASGANLRYQWQELVGDARVPIAGATAATFTPPPATASRRFAVRVSGEGGAADSRLVRLALRGPPTITRHPFTIDFLPGSGSLLLRVAAESVTPHAFQWYAGARGDTRSPLPGATGSTLVARALETAVRYWVRVSNAHGSADSEAALVTPWSGGPVSTSVTFSPAGLTHGNGRFVATGSAALPGNPSTGAVATSTDGRTWAIASTTRYSAVAFGAGRFVAIEGTGTGNRLVASADGLAWTNVFVGDAAARFGELIFDGGRFVALAGNGRIATSVDGGTWTPITLASTTTAGIAFGAGRFVIGAAVGRLFVSTDGLAWTEASAGITEDFRGVAFAAGKFVATAASGTLMTSTDGTSWSRVDVEVHDRWNRMPSAFVPIAAGDRFFGRAPSVSTSVLSSPDGARWGQMFSFGRVTAGADVLLAMEGRFAYRAQLESPLSILLPPIGQVVASGGGVTLAVAATGIAPLSFQWSRNDVPIAGATASALVIPRASSVAAGSYTVAVSNGSGTITSVPALVSVVEGPRRPSDPASRLVNLSILTALTAESPQFQIGTVIGAGSAGKPVVMRAVGPSLVPFGVADPLADPVISVQAGANVVAANDNWGGTNALAAAMSGVGAFPLASAASRDAVVAPTLDAGSYVMSIAAAGDGRGAVLAEIYDAGGGGQGVASAPRLLNLSVLKHLGAALTAGFVVAGGSGTNVLIRAVGPGLAPFGVGGTVANPRLELFDGAAIRIEENDDWGGGPTLGGAFVEVGAFPLDAASRDAALIARLQPGSYTVRVTGSNGATGVALFEVYEVP